MRLQKHLEYPYDYIKKIKVCILCFSSESTSKKVINNIKRAIFPISNIDVIDFKNDIREEQNAGEFDFETVTKLSKLRNVSKSVAADLIFICDPDIKTFEDACRKILEEAILELRYNREVVTFGYINSLDNGTLLSKLIAVDKWLSHRVIRKSLWNLGLGISLPGQCLIISRSLLQGHKNNVNTYLDDLYLGWICRTRQARVCRIPIVVGEEEPRHSWDSLISQRIRWMKGFASICAGLYKEPKAILLLIIHYILYHVFPILLFIILLICLYALPVIGLTIFITLAILLAAFSKNSLLASSVYIITFPLIHVISILFWWIPCSTKYLLKR